MPNYDKLAKTLLEEGRVTLAKHRYNDGTDEEPDIIIHHLEAVVEKDHKIKRIAVYLNYENDDILFESSEVHIFPYITRMVFLKEMLEESVYQAYGSLYSSFIESLGD